MVIFSSIHFKTFQVSNNHDAFADIEETLKDLKETIRIQTENEKRLGELKIVPGLPVF